MSNKCSNIIPTNALRTALEGYNLEFLNQLTSNGIRGISTCSTLGDILNYLTLFNDDDFYLSKTIEDIFSLLKEKPSISEMRALLNFVNEQNPLHAKIMSYLPENERRDEIQRIINVIKTKSEGISNNDDNTTIKLNVEDLPYLFDYFMSLKNNDESNKIKLYFESLSILFETFGAGEFDEQIMELLGLLKNPNFSLSEYDINKCQARLASCLSTDEKKEEIILGGIINSPDAIAEILASGTDNLRRKALTQFDTYFKGIQNTNQIPGLRARIISKLSSKEERETNTLKFLENFQSLQKQNLGESYSEFCESYIDALSILGQFNPNSGNNISDKTRLMMLDYFLEIGGSCYGAYSLFVNGFSEKSKLSLLDSNNSLNLNHNQFGNNERF